MPRAYQENHHYFHEAYKTKSYPWSSASCVQVEKFLEQIFQDSPVDSLLDLGCGEGANVRMAARVGLRAVGLDRETQAIERAADITYQEGLSETVRYLVSDGLALPFVSSFFDIILDHGMFHHLRKSDWGLYRSNIDEILRPRGHYILEVFSTEHRGYGDIPQSRWHIKAGAYRRFFTQEDIESYWGDMFDILALEEKRGEVAGDWHVLMQKKY